MLCARLQVRRLKSKGKKHSRAIVGIFMAGIIIAGVPGAVAAYFMLKANDLVWAWRLAAYTMRINRDSDLIDLACWK